MIINWNMSKLMGLLGGLTPREQEIIEMEKEQTPVERLHDDIRRAVDKIEDDMDDIVRIHCHENDDAG